MVGTFTICENPLEDINISSLDDVAAGFRSSLRSPRTTVGMSSWGDLERSSGMSVASGRAVDAGRQLQHTS